MTDRADLLDYAEQVLDGKVVLGSRGPRTAALLARCALEDWLDDKSAAWSSQSYPYSQYQVETCCAGGTWGS